MKLPAIVNDMDFATYLADPMPEPSLTSSLVKDLLSTAPRKIWQNTKRLNPDAESEQKDTFDLGSAAHRLFTGTGQPIAEIDAADFRSKAAKEARDQAYADGKTPILAKNMGRVRAMADTALEQIRDNPDLGALFAPANQGKLLREATIMWVESGVMCRCRPDFYCPESNIMIHYKTTGVSITPNALPRYAASSGWHMTAAHYAAGGKALTGSAPRQFFFVQETDEPHLALTAILDATFMGEAAIARERSLNTWGRCLQSNRWPGMPMQTISLEMPEFVERQMIEEKDAHENAKRNGQDLLQMMRDWHAPQGWAEPAVQGDKQDERDLIE